MSVLAAAESVTTESFFPMEPGLMGQRIGCATRGKDRVISITTGVFKMSDYAWKVAFDVHGFLRNSNPCFPRRIARALGYSLAEVELALWYWRANEEAEKTRQERWYWVHANA
jgi:hypothetical protein